MSLSYCEPAILTGIDGEPPTYVNAAVASTAADAVTYAGMHLDLDGILSVRSVLMRELDPIACKIRGVDDGWWVECTQRSKKARRFWRIDH